MKKEKTAGMLKFDRIFGDSDKIFSQIIYVLVLVVALVLFIGAIGLLLIWINHGSISGSSIFIQAIGLAFGASNLPPGDGQTFPIWWQAVAFLLGAVFFSGVTITWVGNWLNNRQEAFRNGTARYKFKNHILFLGAGKTLDALLSHCNGCIVVLTSNDVAAVRRRIGNPKVTVLYGDISSKEMLKSVYCELAAEVYIVGEDPDNPRYDEINIACWYNLHELCEFSQCKNIPCYLFLEHSNIAGVLQLSDIYSSDSLLTVLLNHQETLAQMALLNAGFIGQFPGLLDRNGIGYSSNRTVHLVIYGMTEFARSLAISAAHLCHFPNFIRDASLKTRITIISPEIRREANEFISMYSNYFALTETSLCGEQKIPENSFLDIEWEFIDGNISDDNTQKRLAEYYEEDRSGTCYLTVALCMPGFQDNLSSAMYHLPSEYYDIADKEKKGVVPVLVYQPDNNALADIVEERIMPLYGNIIPVGKEKKMGSITNENDCVNFIKERTRRGQLLMYSLWQLFEEKDINETPESSFLNELWRKISDENNLSQLSYIYQANHLEVKMRSIGKNISAFANDDMMVRVMAEVEHNRWVTERLLLGVSPASKEDRTKIMNKSSDAQAIKDRLRKELRSVNLVPFSELSSELNNYELMRSKHVHEIKVLIEKKMNEDFTELLNSFM